MAVLHALTLPVLLGACCCGLSSTPAAANISVSKSGKTRGGIDSMRLCRQWVHSFEEQKTDKDQIYRPVNFKTFPLSRFRMHYKFSINGECEWLSLAPDDAQRLKTGKWSVDPDDKAILRITTEGTTVSYRVIELKKDILRLRRLEKS